jgi:hypothetical protein
VRRRVEPCPDCVLVDWYPREITEVWAWDGWSEKGKGKRKEARAEGQLDVAVFVVHKVSVCGMLLNPRSRRYRVPSDTHTDDWNDDKEVVGVDLHRRRLDVYRRPHSASQSRGVGRPLEPQSAGRFQAPSHVSKWSGVSPYRPDMPAPSLLVRRHASHALLCVLNWKEFWFPGQLVRFLCWAGRLLDFVASWLGIHRVGSNSDPIDCGEWLGALSALFLLVQNFASGK